MEVIGRNRKSRKRNYEKRHREIAEGHSQFLKAFKITSLEYEAQKIQMKQIQVSLFSLNWNCISFSHCVFSFHFNPGFFSAETFHQFDT